MPELLILSFIVICVLLPAAVYEHLHPEHDNLHHTPHTTPTMHTTHQHVRRAGHMPRHCHRLAATRALETN